MKLGFLDIISKNIQISVSMITRPCEPSFSMWKDRRIYIDRQTDIQAEITMLIFAFFNFAKVPRAQRQRILVLFPTKERDYLSSL
jgi:hypothetical protein